jgi:aldehyde:ferredoxin oxidoreductase
MEGQSFGDWMKVGGKGSEVRTTQRPAVLTIGPSGENLGRIACLIHDVANASGQGGFGGVWGSKNLKAISVIGTGSVNVADPDALMESRIWANKEYAFNVDHQHGKERPLNYFWKGDRHARIHGCVGCHAGCQERNSSGMGTDSTCTETSFYTWADKQKHWGRQTDASYIATDLLQKQGVNAFETTRGLPYIVTLARRGILGPGKEIDCDFDISDLGTAEFAEKFILMISNREGIGDDMAVCFCTHTGDYQNTVMTPGLRSAGDTAQSWVIGTATNTNLPACSGTLKVLKIAGRKFRYRLNCLQMPTAARCFPSKETR